MKRLGTEHTRLDKTLTNNSECDEKLVTGRVERAPAPKGINRLGTERTSSDENLANNSESFGD